MLLIYVTNFAKLVTNDFFAYMIQIIYRIQYFYMIFLYMVFFCRTNRNGTPVDQIFLALHNLKIHYRFNLIFYN